MKFGRGEGHIKCAGKNITWKNGNGKKYPLSFGFNMKAAGKNIKRGRGY